MTTNTNNKMTEIADNHLASLRAAREFYRGVIMNEGHLVVVSGFALERREGDLYGLAPVGFSGFGVEATTWSKSTAQDLARQWNEGGDAYVEVIHVVPYLEREIATWKGYAARALQASGLTDECGVAL